MLPSLAIRDFVIVDTLELDFTAGFTVLTGETGAGKSIIIDALSLLWAAAATAAWPVPAASAPSSRPALTWPDCRRWPTGLPNKRWPTKAANCWCGACWTPAAARAVF